MGFERGRAPGLLVVAALTAGAGAEPPAPFTEEALDRGIVYVPTQVQNHGQGMAFADLDGDGDADLVTLGAGSGAVGLFENDGTGHFTNRYEGSGVPLVTVSSGVVAGDYDRDGDLDLYISRWDEPNRLLRNDGAFVFADVTATAGVGHAGRDTGCAWGDVDNDGWLDLYVANWDGPNALYRNLRNGTFEEVASDLSVTGGDEPTFQAVFVDFDRDADADVYLATDRGTFCETLGYRNRLFENVGGTYEEITEASGTEACADAMCIAIGDLDRNGYSDFYCTNTPPGNVLLMNQGDGTFLGQAREAGVSVFITGWGSVFFDYDNDGYLDLYVCNTFFPNRLFRYDGSFPCVDVAPGMNVDTGGSSYTVATADIDLDGDLDLLLQNRQENLHLFVNHEGASRRWVRFDVIGEGASRHAIGAIVEVTAGGATQMREVVAGCNFKNQNELAQHFGLDAAVDLDTVSVTWPGGTTRVVASLSSDVTWTLYPPDKLGDGDHDGDRDLDDFVAFASCMTGDAPGALEPGCEMMDFEGDADVDLADFDGFLAVYEGPQDDCDDDGVADLVQILESPEVDANGNGVLDSCETVPGDVDGDGVVGIDDLLILVGSWGPCPGCPADLDGDGDVDIDDLLTLVGNWT